MGSLIYGAIMSLDGYVEDARGSFGWAEPDNEVHAFVNELMRPIGTHLYGRRMYETMAPWEDMPDLASQPAAIQEFAEIWRASDKVVFSTTLDATSSARTRLERTFEPEAVQRLKAGTVTDIAIGGAALAGHAIEAGLVDQLQLFVVPTIVGGGKPALPVNDVRLDLELAGQRSFGNGTVYLEYKLRSRTQGARA
jgi:dihydrofolate reductase